MVKSLFTVTILPVILSIVTATPLPGVGDSADDVETPTFPNVNELPSRQIDDNINTWVTREPTSRQRGDKIKRPPKAPKDEWKNIMEWINEKEEVVSDSKFEPNGDLPVKELEWRSRKAALRREGIDIIPDWLLEERPNDLSLERLHDRTNVAREARRGSFQ